MAGGPGAILALTVEVLAIYAFGAPAWHAPGPGAVTTLRWALALGAGVLAVALWGRFAAPKARRRLGGGLLVLFKAAVLGASVAAFSTLYSQAATLAFGLAVGLHCS